MSKQFAFIVILLLPLIIFSQVIFILYNGSDNEASDFTEYFKNRALMDFIVFDMDQADNVSSIIGKITVEKPLAVLLVGSENVMAVAPYINNVPLILGQADNIPDSIMNKDNICGVKQGGGADSLAYYLKESFLNIDKAGILFHMSYSYEKAKNLKGIADSLGLEMELGNIASQNDIKMAVKLLKASGCNLILFFEDRFFSEKNHFNELVNNAKKEDIPLITAGDRYIDNGIMAAFISDVYNAGYIAGNVAIRLKNGEKPSDIGMVPAGGLSMKYVEKIRRQYNIIISPSMIERSEKL